MMVDTTIFAKRLDALEDYLERLRCLGEASEADYLADPKIHDLAARYLHLAMEATIDIANHWISDVGLRTPDTRDIFVVLEQAGEIELSNRLQDSLPQRAGAHYLTRSRAYKAIREDLGDLDALRRWALGKLDPDKT